MADHLTALVFFRNSKCLKIDKVVSEKERKREVKKKGKKRKEEEREGGRREERNHWGNVSSQENLT